SPFECRRHRALRFGIELGCLRVLLRKEQRISFVKLFLGLLFASTGCGGVDDRYYAYQSGGRGVLLGRGQRAEGGGRRARGSRRRGEGGGERASGSGRGRRAEVGGRRAGG